MTLVRPIVRSIVRGIVRGDALDADAAAIVAAIQAADGQALEPGVVSAIENLIVGCKDDASPNAGVSNWQAIQGLVMLAGARTLSGALVPWKGPVVTNHNFVAADYARKTGLKGNASTKRITLNRNAILDAQNNCHIATWLTEAATPSTAGYMGAGINETGSTNFLRSASSNIGIRYRNQTSSVTSGIGSPDATGFIGCSRHLSASYIARVGSANTTVTQASQSPVDRTYQLFSRDGEAESDGRHTYASTGGAVDMALLEARISTYLSDIAAAIL